MVESFVRRACLILDHDPYSNALEYIDKAFSDYGRKDCIEEIFVLRDVVAHNHLWSMNISWNHSGQMTIHDVDHRAGGDKKYRRVINKKTGRTKQLKMRLRPTSVCFEEAFIVMHEAYKFFEYLETTDSRIISLDAIIFEYNENVYRFREFIKEVPFLQESTIISSA
jgi:hypothetical protein